jgi:type III secretion protein N (ATPase)
VRTWLAKHKEIELLLQMGEYRKGTDPEADEAIARMPALRQFLRQGPEELAAAQATNAELMKLTGEPVNG